MTDRASARQRIAEAIEAGSQFIRCIEGAIDGVEIVKPRKAVGLRLIRADIGAALVSLQELKDSLDDH